MNNRFLIVTIGASAGSLPAIIEFFDRIPADTNAAFVVVTHLMRDRRSRLDEILALHSSLPVLRVENDIAILPATIYILPESRYITFENDTLRVQPREVAPINHAIDIFLNSLAENSGHTGIAVILSGGGKDGLEGGTALGKAGGKVLVQEPASAQVDALPSTIIKYDHPDSVQEPGELADLVLKLIEEN
ncbi:MAG: hypothetical protein EOO45_09020 [Flavobacterium sp.]|nr:MAG: hypothetical protein EOO45_09020 [Flavobacterium sp.]